MTVVKTEQAFVDYERWLRESSESPYRAAGDVSPEEVADVVELLKSRDPDSLGKSALDSEAFRQAVYDFDHTKEQD